MSFLGFGQVPKQVTSEITAEVSQAAQKCLAQADVALVAQQITLQIKAMEKKYQDDAAGAAAFASRFVAWVETHRGTASASCADILVVLKSVRDFLQGELSGGLGGGGFGTILIIGGVAAVVWFLLRKH